MEIIYIAVLVGVIGIIIINVINIYHLHGLIKRYNETMKQVDHLIDKIGTKFKSEVKYKFSEHDVVYLSKDFKLHNLKKGHKGTIIHLYENICAYEVEFIKNGQNYTFTLGEQSLTDEKPLKNFYKRKKGNIRSTSNSTLAKLRLKAKLTQKQVADLTGLSQKTISGIERGDRKKKGEKYKKILKVLRDKTKNFTENQDEKVYIKRQSFSKWRKEVPLSLKEVAYDIGISHETIRNYESGLKVRLQNVDKINNYYNEKNR